MLASSMLTPLSSHESRLLAETLGESPETSTALHVLRHGTGRAYTLGDLSGVRAVAVEADCLPGEPYVFGVDASAICELLDALDGWDCVLVEVSLFTLESWQGRGFATAAASIVSHGIQATGRVPVWPTLDDNWASMRVARKVGYTEAFQRCYVIRE